MVINYIDNRIFQDNKCEKFLEMNYIKNNIKIKETFLEVIFLLKLIIITI